MISIRSNGDFKKTQKLLQYLKNQNYESILRKYGQDGVKALSAANPTNSGETADSWYYEVHTYKNGGAKICWCNDNVINGVPVAILIQYGHATRNGGYIQGIDYINPALRPVFQKIADAVWREVSKL